MGYPALLRLMRTPRLPVVDCDASADLNGLVRFTERRNLVPARVPSHFKRSIPTTIYSASQSSHHFCMSVLGIPGPSEGSRDPM